MFKNLALKSCFWNSIYICMLFINIFINYLKKFLVKKKLKNKIKARIKILLLLIIYIFASFYILANSFYFLIKLDKILILKFC